MRMLATMIGYACTAAVITVGLGLTYLWGSNRLDDEKVFRMVALLHDVDIDKIADETEETVNEAPGEEPSPEDVEWRRQVLARNHEVKMEALRRGKLNFDASLLQLNTSIGRFHELADKLERRLVEEGELSSKRSLTQVVQKLELMRPDQAKAEILKVLEDDQGEENVIKIMNAMNTAKLKKILQRFTEPGELDQIHVIIQKLLDGGSQQAVFENALEELQRLESQ